MNVQKTVIECIGLYNILSMIRFNCFLRLDDGRIVRNMSSSKRM
jgi:hypothetical protein